MMETIVEKPFQSAESFKNNEEPEMVSSPAVKANLSETKRQPALLKELFGTAIEDLIEELKDCIADCGREGANQAASELTLLNLHRYRTAPYRSGGQCPVCGATKTIPDVPIRCIRSNDEANLSSHTGTIPVALIIERLHPELFADICGDCGHVELKVNNPQDLHNQYLQSKRVHET